MSLDPSSPSRFASTWPDPFFPDIHVGFFAKLFNDITPEYLTKGLIVGAILDLNRSSRHLIVYMKYFTALVV